MEASEGGGGSQEGLQVWNLSPSSGAHLSQHRRAGGPWLRPLSLSMLLPRWQRRDTGGLPGFLTSGSAGEQYHPCSQRPVSPVKSFAGERNTSLSVFVVFAWDSFVLLPFPLRREQNGHLRGALCRPLLRTRGAVRNAQPPRPRPPPARPPSSPTVFPAAAVPLPARPCARAPER